MSPNSDKAYVKVLVIWLVGLPVTAIIAAVVGFSSGFSDNKGLEGSKAWPAAFAVIGVCLALMVVSSAAIVRGDHRNGGTVSTRIIAVTICTVITLIVLLLVRIAVVYL